MDFFQSDWFMWVVMVIVFGSILGAFKSSSEDFDFPYYWKVAKPFVIGIFGLIFLPLLIIFGRTKERKTDKSPPL